MSPVPSGKSATLPFYPGHLYVAFYPEDPVYNVISNKSFGFITICFIVKDAVTYFHSRPAMFACHDHVFPLIKFKVSKL